MNAKTKSIINIVVASLGVLAFILFIIAVVKTMGFFENNAFIMETGKDGSIKDVSPEAWKVIHDGGKIKGAGAEWTGIKTGTEVEQVAAFKDWLAHNVKDIAKVLKKGDLKPYQIDGLVLQNGEYQGTVGILEIFLIAFNSSTVSALFKAMIVISLISWIAGIVTSILVKKERKSLGIVSGGANVVFAIVRVTAIPFLVTSIMSHIAITKALKNK
ncbi:hypothetical protein [Mycoplasma todarodis]|uniref:hypothetical protein n=1 Tax=Mycoplasma todarodis TaxID=1937191 RepID=UPI003B2FEA63